MYQLYYQANFLHAQIPIRKNKIHRLTQFQEKARQHFKFGKSNKISNYDSFLDTSIKDRPKDRPSVEKLELVCRKLGFEALSRI